MAVRDTTGTETHPPEVAALSDVAVRLRAGDAGALGELYDAVGRRAFALARRVLGNSAEAEDAVHEAFAQLWERAPSLAPIGRVDSLVMTMVHRRAIDAVRRRRGARVALTDTTLLMQIDERAEAALDEMLTAVSEAVLRTRLQALLDGLPAEQRAVVRGVYYEALTLREVSERHAIPLGTAKSRLRLAMARLGDALRTEVQR